MRITSITSCGAALAVLAFALAGCGHDGAGRASPVAPGFAGQSVASGKAGTFHTPPPFDPSDFDGHAVDHPCFPLAPGTVWSYEGETEDGFETTRVEVLHDTKVILGVQATIVRDRVYLDGELIEDTFDWYAQDRHGNVWYLGEDVKNYEGGVLVDTQGSWEAGVGGAEPGFIMLVHPEVGDAYAQEHAAGVAEDKARVVSLKQFVAVPYGQFDRCIEIMEWTPLEPGQRQFKYFAPGVGLVLELTPRHGRERGELISVTHP